MPLVAHIFRGRVFSVKCQRWHYKQGNASPFATCELKLAGKITKIELRRRCITDYELLLMVRTLGMPLSSLITPKVDELNEFF